MNLKGKKVAVLGISTEGIATAQYLIKKGAKVTACDKKPPQKLGDNLRKIKRLNLSLRLGKDYLQNLKEYEILFRTPGMPLYLSELKEAEDAGVKISSQTKLFFDLCPCPIIGVTGTKGKGTTSSLIFEILKKEGRDVFLGGNIGNSPFGFLDELTPKSLVVLELSSFQLEDLTVSPHIAVVLNITSDHLFSVAPDSPNYHLSKKDYLRAKENIVRYQNKKNFAVLNFDYETSRSFARLTQGLVYYFSRRNEVKGAYVSKGMIFVSKEEFSQELPIVRHPELGSGSQIMKIPKPACQRLMAQPMAGRRVRNDNKPATPILIGKVEDLILPGAHNFENVTAAICASFLAGASISAIKRAIFEFKGLEHRLEFVREVGRVKYYNDSFSTTPETTIAAIRAFNKPIILIAGGSEKGLDYTQLGKEIVSSSVKTLILIGQMADRIKKAVKQNCQISKSFNCKLKIIKNLKTMREIIKTVAREVEPGDIVVLSPGSASFDMFKNYKDRGSQFKDEITKIQE